MRPTRPKYPSAKVQGERRRQAISNLIKAAAALDSGGVMSLELALYSASLAVYRIIELDVDGKAGERVIVMLGRIAKGTT